MSAPSLILEGRRLDELKIYDVINDYFFDYRKIIKDKTYTEDEIISILRTYSYITLTGRYKESGNKISIFIIEQESRFIQGVNEITKFIATIDITGSIYEVIFIIPNIIMESKKNIVASLRELNKVVNTVIIAPYRTFIIPVPLHAAVPKHEIVSPEQFLYEAGGEHLHAPNMKYILSNDPPVVWLGAKTGDIIKIYGDSTTVGKFIGYRIVR